MNHLRLSCSVWPALECRDVALAAEMCRYQPKLCYSCLGCRSVHSKDALGCVGQKSAKIELLLHHSVREFVQKKICWTILAKRKTFEES